jgi:predicted NAD/FAD-dependent oxidoreductase
VVDIGASYFTAQELEFVEVVDRLVGQGVVRPWTTGFHVCGPEGLSGVASGPLRYAAPMGLRSVVAAIAAEAPGLAERVGEEVSEVVPEGTRVLVDGVSIPAVALAMPQPQAERLMPGLPTSPIPWEPVIAVTCVFDKQYWFDLDGVFVNDDPVLTWIADDGSRRGDGAPVLVAHVHPVLAARHLADPDTVLPWAVTAIQRVLGIGATPRWAAAHRWTFAKPLAGSDLPFWLHQTAPVGLAGDAWAGGPRVEAAWLSGRRLGEALVARLHSAPWS